MVLAWQRGNKEMGKKGKAWQIMHALLGGQSPFKHSVSDLRPSHWASTHTCCTSNQDASLETKTLSYESSGDSQAAISTVLETEARAP